MHPYATCCIYNLLFSATFVHLCTYVNMAEVTIRDLID